MNTKRTLIAFLISIFSLSAFAKVQTELVEYKEGSTTLEGVLVYDDAMKAKAPGVIIVPEWTGVNEYSKSRARQMAEMGYVAFVADIYGKGIRPQDPKSAGETAGKYKNDRKLMRARAQAAFETLKKNPKVNSDKIVALGYCFGGTTVLEMAMAGLPLRAAVSFHGGLDFPKTLADVKNIKARLQIHHGAVDPYAPMEQLLTFQKALDENKVTYEVSLYSQAVHSFTNPDSGNDPSKGAAYNAIADKRSFESMKAFLSEVTR